LEKKLKKLDMFLWRGYNIDASKLNQRRKHKVKMDIRKRGQGNDFRLKEKK